MKVRDKDLKKMTLCICYLHYEFVVMSFRLTNMLATSLDLMNRVHRRYFGLL